MTKNLWLFVLFAIVAASLLVGGCSHLQMPEYVPNVRVIDGFKVSKTNWVIDIEVDNSPDCNWLKKNNIFGIAPVDSYEITTEEYCDV